MPRRLAIAFAFTAAAFAAQPASATVEIGGSVFARALGQLSGQPPAVDSQLRTWASGLEPGPRHDLSASATVNAFLSVDGGPNSVDAHEEIDAHWESADAGSVAVPLRGWIVHVPGADDGLVQFNTADSGRSDWTYNFTATADGAFNLDFDLTGRDDDLGLGTWDLLVSDDSNPTRVVNLSRDFDFDPVHRVGSVSEALVAGHSYQFALRGSTGVDVGRTFDDFAGSESDLFNWRITGDTAAVPEAQTWALAVLGFGLAGSALRRRSPRPA